MKKYLAIILAICMVLSLAACGSSTSGTTTNDASATTDSGSSAAATTDAGSDAADASDSADAAATGLPTVDDYDLVYWDGTSEPTKDNGPWGQSYSVADALAEMAAEYASVSPTYTYTVACHDPANSAPGEFLTAWANAVTIATEGAVAFNIGYSGAMSATMQALDDMKDGAIDFCWTLPCYFKGYMPYTNVIQTPGLEIPNATVGSYVMWDLYKSSSELQAEFADDGELLFVWTNCPSPLSYKGDHEITSLSEVSGNIRGNNGPAQTFIDQVGATVYSCAIGDVYTNVSTGIINYLITDWHGIASFALYDEGILNYYVDTNIGCSAYALMCNSDIWGAMPSDIQDAIKSVSGDYLLNLVQIWEYWTAYGRYCATSTGGTIFEPSDALAAELKEANDAVAATWVSEQADTDVAQNLYDTALSLVAQYSAQFDF